MDEPPRPPSRGIVVSAALDPQTRDYSAQEPRTKQTKNFRKYLPNALYCHQKGVLLPCYQTIKHMTTSTLAPASTATPTANNDLYILSVSTVIKELRNRGWLVLASNIVRSVSSHFAGIKYVYISGAEFREHYTSYCQERLRGAAAADNGDGLLKIMVEACEMEKSTWGRQ